MKIIDFECKGNLVRFYLGRDSLRSFTGDDWNDTPYEHNAGRAYDEYIAGVADIAFPFDALVLEPCSGDYRDSRYCKDDMKNKKVPCIIVIPPAVAKENYDTSFQFWSGCKEALRFFFHDTMNPTNGIVQYCFDSMTPPYQRKEELQYVIRVPEDGNLKGAVPIWEKELLTLSEAAAYFGLGLSKVRSLAEDEECDYILRIGPKSLIKRKRFEEFLDQAYSI